MLDFINKRKKFFLVTFFIINLLLAIFWFVCAILPLLIGILFIVSDLPEDSLFIPLLLLLIPIVFTVAIIYSFVLFAKLKKKAELLKKDLIISITTLFINLLPIIIALIIYT